MILNVKESIYKKVVRKILSNASAQELYRDFSHDPLYFCPLIKDISLGKHSPNYRFISEVLGNSSEEPLMAKTSEILSLLENREDNSRQDDLYSLLDTDPSADTDEVREKWLDLTEIYKEKENHSLRRKIDEAYSILTDPEKRRSYDRELYTGRTVKVKTEDNVSSPLKLIAVPLLILAIITFISYRYYGISPGVLAENSIPGKEESGLDSINQKTGEFRNYHEHRSGSGNHDRSDASAKTIVKSNREKNPDKKRYELSKKDDNTNQKNIIKNEETQADIPDKTPDSDGKIGNEASSQQKSESTNEQEEESRPPVRIDELLTEKDTWTLDFGINYTNIDSTSESIVLVDFPTSSGETFTTPLVVNGQVDQDISISSLSLRYGLTERMEVFGFGSLFADFQRVSLGGETDSDFDLNFNTAGIGATYQVMKEGRYPALLATSAINVIENTNFGSFRDFNGSGSDPDNEENGFNGNNLDDDFSPTYFKTFSLALSSYYTVDPIVFFLRSRYIQNFKREDDDVSIDPGENFSLSPQLFFVVNPYITVNWGMRFAVNSKDRVNGESINSLRTRLSPLFGVSYEIKDDLIVSFDAEYINDPDFNRASAALRFNYNF